MQTWPSHVYIQNCSSCSGRAKPKRTVSVYNATPCTSIINCIGIFLKSSRPTVVKVELILHVSLIFPIGWSMRNYISLWNGLSTATLLIPSWITPLVFISGGQEVNWNKWLLWRLASFRTGRVFTVGCQSLQLV